MKVWWIFFVISMCSVSPGSAATIEQVCEEDDCVQIGKNYGTINLEGRQLQIGINKGTVNVIGSEEDRVEIQNYAVKVANLENQINHHLDALRQKEKRIFGDMEVLQKATEYTVSLLKQIDQLDKRIALLDEQHALTQRIIEAKNQFDVPLIKELLKQKQKLDDKQAAETAFELAGFQRLDMEYSEAYKNFQKAIFLRNNNPDYLVEAGAMALQLAHLNEAESWFRKALPIIEKHYGVSSSKFGHLVGNLARVLEEQNRFDEAELLMRQALNIIERNNPDNHPNVALHISGLSSLLYTTNRLAEAEPLMRRALQIDEAHYGDNHPNVARNLNNLAQLLHRSNRLAEAEPLMRRALQIDENHYGDNNPIVATRLNNLALLLAFSNRISEVEPLLRRALQIDVHIYGENHPAVARDLGNLGNLLTEMNRFDEAEPLFRRALQISKNFWLLRKICG